MDHIPTEVLHEIFIKVDLIGKLECMLVCRLWYDTLDRRSLLDTPTITDKRLPKFKEMIEHFSYRGPQVEYLTIDLSPSLSFDKRMICNLFPNLREIHLKTCKFSITRSNHLSSPFQFTHPSMSKLEKIKEHGDCELTRQLAMSNMCDKLKSVELTFVPAISPTSGEILAELKNMPVLETLKLRHFRIKIMDLETVHYNVPSIKSLCLGNTILASGEFPTDIISATLITKLDLHLSRADDIHTHIQFYKYVGKKYASVNNPSFQDGAGPREGLNHVRQVYNEGILPLYQNIGPHTDSFSFNHYCDDLDAFRKFDDFGMKLKELTIVVRFNHGFLFLEKLVQSQQSKYIQTLISKGAVPAPLDMMINMEVLKTLEISCKNNYCFRGGRAHRTVNLSQLVESCPETLTHLTIEAVNLTFNESTSNPTSIQYLKLADVVIKSPTTITGASFPELSILHLKPIVTSQFTMSLPKNHLKEVTIHVKYPNDEEGGPSVKIINKDEPHRKVIWSTCNSDIGGMIDEHFKPTSVSEETQMVYFTCGSAKDLSYSTI